MDSYIQYRLNDKDWSWVELYQRRMGNEAFREYRDNVYRKLMAMQPKSSFDIEKNVREDNRDIFIKLCCLFMNEGNPGYKFSPNYKQIICDEKTTMVKAG